MLDKHLSLGGRVKRQCEGAIYIRLKYVRVQRSGIDTIKYHT